MTGSSPSDNVSDRIRTELPARLAEIADFLGREADRRGSGAALVGGAVRDLFLGRPVRETDVVVEHPVEPVVEEAARHFGGRVVRHPRFLTFTLHLVDTAVDVVTARAETYPATARLPVVTPADIITDLSRRDFSVNAVAARLDGARFGEIMDPHGGRADLTAGHLRVLHDASFVDDPTRIFRAARFCGRFGFTPTEKTRALIQAAVEVDGPGLLSPARLRHELEGILVEEDPLPALRYVAAWGAMRFWDPEWRVLSEHHALLTQPAEPERTARLHARLSAWLAPWGKDAALAAMDALACERTTKRAVRAFFDGKP